MPAAEHARRPSERLGGALAGDTSPAGGTAARTAPAEVQNIIEIEKLNDKSDYLFNSPTAHLLENFIEYSVHAKIRFLLPLMVSGRILPLPLLFAVRLTPLCLFLPARSRSAAATQAQ